MKIKSRMIVVICIVAVMTMVGSSTGFAADEAETRLGNMIASGSGTISVDEVTVFYQDGNEDWVFSGDKPEPASGIIIQMADDDSTIFGSGNPYYEAPGFPITAYPVTVSYVHTNDTAVDPSKTYYVYLIDSNGQITYWPVENPVDESIGIYYEQFVPGSYCTVTFENGEYEGDIYNSTGYYSQPADALDVIIAEDAALTGDIALTSHVHGVLLNGRDVDDMIAAINETNVYHPEVEEYYETLDDITYVFIDADGNVTSEKDEAYAIQFYGFSELDDYLAGHIINMINYNGAAHLDVTVNGTWKPAYCSLVTYLEIAEGAHVFCEVTPVEDGSFIITPSDEEIEPGIYGTKFV